MKKSIFVRFLALIMAFAMIAPLTGCAPTVEEPPLTESATYTISIVNKAGTPIEKCRVVLYTDSELSKAVDSGLTDANGEITFTTTTDDQFVVALSKQPDGYAVEESYALTGEKTTIVLEPGVMTNEDMDSVTYSLGDAVLDFTITAPDGTEYILSALFEEKKAVVLNFWYLGCSPCKMEFPYLQEAYDQLGDDLAVLALNPYDGDNEQVAAFQADNGYTFTMAKCDERWSKMMQIGAYPTTVIIDRYGNICLIHQGMVTDTQTFLDMFGYFVSDDYEQEFFRSAGQIPTDAS